MGKKLKKKTKKKLHFQCILFYQPKWQENDIDQSAFFFVKSLSIFSRNDFRRLMSAFAQKFLFGPEIFTFRRHFHFCQQFLIISKNL